MRRTLTLISGATALVLWSVGLASASSAPAWSVQPTPVVPGSALSGLACVSVSECEAVGGIESYPSAAERMLAETWNGSAWAEQTAVEPAGAKDSYLDAVSCVTPEDCLAVGSYEAAHLGPFLPFSEQWDGGTWTLQPMPRPGGSVSLNGVSCASPENCIAVGNWVSRSGAQRTLAESWDGSAWTIQATPARNDSTLQAVSCPVAGHCTAVGSYYKHGLYLTLAERWNGTVWIAQHSPNPTGPTNNFLNSVSCSSADVCTAAGATAPPGPNGPEVPLAERWSGGQWTLQPIPSPGDTRFSYLEGISCASATRCVAVGQHNTNSGGYTPLAERWNGTAWRLQPTARPTGHRGLAAVWCGATCTAVGFRVMANDQSNALAEGT